MRSVFKISVIRLRAFIQNRRGATAIEYALMAAGIALALITVVYLMGDDVLGLFQSVQTGLNTNL